MKLRKYLEEPNIGILLLGWLNEQNKQKNFESSSSIKIHNENYDVDMN